MDCSSEDHPEDSSAQHQINGVGFKLPVDRQADHKDEHSEPISESAFGDEHHGSADEAEGQPAQFLKNVLNQGCSRSLR